MIPRKSLASWQEFAQGKICVQFGFASWAGLRNDMNASAAADFGRRVGQNCYPFPTSWPDPLRVRSFFLNLGLGLNLGLAWQVVANVVTMQFFPFASAAIVVDSAYRTTNKRGSSKCGKQFFSSLFSLCHWPAVSAAHVQTRQRHAPVLALWAVRHLVLSPKITLLNRPWSVVPLVYWLAALACAANRLTPNSTRFLTASQGKPWLAVSISTPTHRKIGQGPLRGESHV
jgi:hypothetical protein